jgi:hypothetical protein
MQKTIKNELKILVYFFSILLVLLIGICMLFINIPAGVSNTAIFQSYSNTHQVDYLFLGDSHTLFNIQAKVLGENYFNYSAASKNSYVDFIRNLKPLIDAGKFHPKIIFMQAAFHSFGKRRRPFRKRGPFISTCSTNEKDVIDSLEKDTIKKATSKTSIIKAITKKFKTIIFEKDIRSSMVRKIIRFYFFKKLKSKNMEISAQGSGQFLSGGWPGGGALRVKAYFSEGPQNVICDLNLAFHKYLLNYFKENNIEVIFIRYPYFKDYLANLKTSNIDFSPLDNLITQFIEEKLIRDFWDFSEFFFVNNKHTNKESLKSWRSIFYNSDHLNTQGANEFSEYLKSKIEKFESSAVLE